MLSPATLGSEGVTLMPTKELFLLGFPFTVQSIPPEHQQPIFSLQLHQVPEDSETAHLQEQLQHEEEGPTAPGPIQCTCNTYGAHRQHSQLTPLRK